MWSKCHFLHSSHSFTIYYEWFLCFYSSWGRFNKSPFSCVNVPFAGNNHTQADMYTKGNRSEQKHVRMRAGAHVPHMCTDLCKAVSSSKHKTNNILPILMPVCVVDNFPLFCYDNRPSIA